MNGSALRITPETGLVGIGLPPQEYGTHALRHTKLSIIYKVRGTLRTASILTPLVTGIYTPLIGLPLVGPTLLAGIGGIVTGALSGLPIGLDVLKVGGGVLTPGAQCSQQADGFTIAVAKGITIGGNSIDGLG